MLRRPTHESSRVRANSRFAETGVCAHWTSPSRGKACKAGRALLLQPLVARTAERDEHLLECGNPLPEINVRVVGHDFASPCCTRRYAAASGPASKSVKRIGFARCSVYLRGAFLRIEAPRKVSRGRSML